MSQDATCTKLSKGRPDLCPACGQPCSTVSTDSEHLSGTSVSSKRPQDSKLKPSSHQRKKLRSSDDNSDGKFKRPWDKIPNCPVYVNVCYKDDTRRWVPGIVDRVYKCGDGDDKISVKVQDEEGNWGLPATIHKNNHDPIPCSKPGDDSYNLRDYVITRDEGTEMLSDIDLKHWQCIKHHAGKTFETKKVAEQDIIGQSILNDDPDKLTSMRNLVCSMMQDKDVLRVVKLATGDESCSAQHALAYLVGQFCGIELSVTSNTGVDAKEMLDQIGSNDNVLCPISQVFLMSAMCVRTKKTGGFNPTVQLFDSRGKEVLSDQKKLNTRLSKLRTASLPARPYGMLPCLDRPGPKIKSNSQTELSKSSKKMQLDSRQSLTQEGHVMVSSSTSLLDGNSKCGEGKARVYPAVICTMSDNKPYVRKEGQIGDAPSKPVVLTRTNADASKVMIERAKQQDGDHKPILKYVDGAKDLRGNIARRNGLYTNNVNDLARDLICEIVQKYHCQHVEMICLTMDVAAYMTILRVIPHAKRGKMEGVKLPHGSLSRVKKGDDDLTQYGARSDLLTCGDQHFMELLFGCVCNQARLLEKGVWELHRRFGAFALAIVGGSPEACVVVGVGGKQNIRLNTKSMTVSCEAVEEEFVKRELVKIEEGEMMVYAAARSIFQLGFTHPSSDEGIDCVSAIYSDDSDTFAGIGMQFIYNLESTCLITGKKFNGAVYIQGPRKSVTQLTKLGRIFTTNFEFDPELCPTGRGFFFLVDLISVYYRLEQDSSLPRLPDGHRAIAATAVPYTLVNHDYLKMAPHGLTYSNIIAALKSTSYHRDVKDCNKDMISPINLTRRAVFMGNNHNNDKGYNLPGVLILLHHAFLNRSATKKFLSMKYNWLLSKKDTAVPSEPLPYNVIRAAAIMAGEKQALPDPVALLAHISCANQIFRRWSFYLYNSKIRTDDELPASCYVKSEVKGRTVMSIEYYLSELEGVYRTTWNDETLVTKLRQSFYGYLLPKAEVALKPPVPFNPLDEIKKALHNQGLYPSVKVMAELLPALPASPVPQNTNTEPLEDIFDNESDESDGEDSSDSDDEVSVAGSLSGNEGQVGNESDND